MIPDVNLNTLPPGILAPGEKLDPKALETKIESMFMETMLKSMEETVDAEDGFYGDSSASDIYRGMVREQMAASLTNSTFKTFNMNLPVSSSSSSANPATAKPVSAAPVATPAPLISPKLNGVAPDRADAFATRILRQCFLGSREGCHLVAEGLATLISISGEVKYHNRYGLCSALRHSGKCGRWSVVVIESGPKGTYRQCCRYSNQMTDNECYTHHNEANLSAGVGQRVQAGDEIAQVGINRPRHGTLTYISAIGQLSSNFFLKFRLDRPISGVVEEMEFQLYNAPRMVQEF